MRPRVILPLVALVVAALALGTWWDRRDQPSATTASAGGRAHVDAAVRQASTRVPPRRNIVSIEDPAAPAAQHAAAAQAAGAAALGGGPPLVAGGGQIDTTWDIGDEDRARYTQLAATHLGGFPAEPWTVRWAFLVAGAPVVDAAEVTAAVQRAYSDPRGWSLGGAIRFEQVPDAESADFLLVLAEAAVIPEYSEDCLSWQTGEPDASCTVGSAVLINDLRWRDGALGDAIALDEFRLHEINHETGHWLGQGHFSCRGGAAAVNQQQFRSLQGCTANAWPLPWEKAMVALRFGLWPEAGAYEPYDEITPVEDTTQGDLPAVDDEADVNLDEAETTAAEGVADDTAVAANADEGEGAGGEIANETSPTVEDAATEAAEATD